jgi:hypothetical protein
MDSHSAINLFHVIVVTAIFMYVGLQRAAVHPLVFKSLIVVGVVVLAYHAYSAYMRFLGSQPGMWVNLIHVLLVAPLLLVVGFSGVSTPNRYFDMMLMLGFASFGYHAYRLLK